VKTEGNNEGVEGISKVSDGSLEMTNLGVLGPILKAEAKKRSQLKTEKRRVLLMYNENNSDGLSNMF
jgi:hypothetical protein